MPQIIVAADRGAAFGEGAVTFRERVNVTDFESQHFAAHLIERLGWAVEDADMVEQDRHMPAEAAAPEGGPRERSDRVEQTDRVEQADRNGQVEPGERVERHHEEPVAIHAPA